MLLVFATRFDTNLLVRHTQECLVHEFAEHNAAFRRHDQCFLEEYHGTHTLESIRDKRVTRF